MLKKMTAVEKSLKTDTDALLAWLRADGRLAACHLASWVVAHRSHALDATLRERAVLTTRWLLALGMTEAGLALVRTWLFEYYEYDTADDNMKKKARTLYAHSPHDYGLLKTYLRLVDFYRHDRLFFAHAEAARRQMLTLRAALLLEPWASTPPHLGRMHYCQGCLTWASLVEPTSAVLHTMLVVAPPSSKKRKEQLREFKDDTATLSWGTNAPMGHVASMSNAYYDPVDGRLYCHHGWRAGAAGAAAVGVIRPTVQWLREHRDVVDELLVEDHAAPEAAAAASSDIGRLAVTSAGGDEFTCREPLMEVDMVGAWRYLHGQYYGLCDYCGRLAEVNNACITNLGLTCGRHALPTEYGRYHRMWTHLRGKPTPARMHEAAEEGRRAAGAPCWVCRAAPAAMELDVYDFEARLLRIPLCGYHLSLCQGKLPLPHRAVERAFAVPPVRIDTLAQWVTARA